MPPPRWSETSRQTPPRRQPSDHVPRLLDLYCCQGGASAGYTAAGFHVTGVDLHPQPRYPYRPFLQADALTYLRQLIDTGDIRHYDAIHASPPCQRHTKCQRIQGREHPALIAPTRQLMHETGLPYIIENVPPDGIDDDPLKDPAELCGAMFGLRTYRHRWFETSFALTTPAHPRHNVETVKMGRALRDGDWYHAVGNFSGVPYVRRDMQVPWMNRDGIRESIPPVYAEHVGRQLMTHLAAQKNPAGHPAGSPVTL